MNPHAFPFAGLTDDEVADARKKSGANVYHFEQDYTLIKTIFRLVKEPMILLLMVAALIYFISGAISDAFFILFAIVFQSAISLYQVNRSNKAVLGIIYVPNQDQCFHAVKGNGAYLNDMPIKTSDQNSLRDALLVTGFPYDDFGREAQYISLFRALMKNTRGIRRLGSAALDLAWVACGRFEAFYEYGLNPWDVAAGAIIIEEAGGTVSGFHTGDPIFEEDILASNGHIHQELQKIIQEHFTQ